MTDEEAAKRIWNGPTADYTERWRELRVHGFTPRECQRLLYILWRYRVGLIYPRQPVR